MKWLRNNAAPVEAVAALITALVAVLALVGIKYQLDAADALQRAQSAREAYRAHLALAVAHPEFAGPPACAHLDPDTGAAYAAFVDHLIWSAEQMLAVEDGWSDTFRTQLEPHRDYLCTGQAPGGETDATDLLLKHLRVAICPTEPACEGSSG